MNDKPIKMNVALFARLQNQQMADSLSIIDSITKEIISHATQQQGELKLHIVNKSPVHKFPQKRIILFAFYSIVSSGMIKLTNVKIYIDMFEFVYFDEPCYTTIISEIPLFYVPISR